MNISGKVAVVTGSAKRVGKSILLALAKRGAHVVINYRTSREEAEKTRLEAQACGVEAFIIQADISTVKGAHKLISGTLKIFKNVDILVNSASIYDKTPFGKISEGDWDSHMNTNLKAAFFLSQEAGIHMRRQKRGKIVNIIDSDVRQPYNDYLPYFVSKSGMVGLTYCLAKELAPHIQVNAISPGPVFLQPQWGASVRRAILKQTPLQRIGSPEDIANAVLFCIEGTDFMTGAVIPVDGGQHIE